jgi:ERCC4-type nuclease
MKVIIDEREHDLYDQCNSILCGMSTPSFAVLSKEVLDLGDILIQTDEGKDVLLIERKSINDLLSSIKDGRYEEQSYRLLNAGPVSPHSVIYLIEGIFSQIRTPLEKKIVLSSIVSLNYFKGFSVYKTASTKETAEWIIHMADKIDKDFMKGKLPYYLTRPYLKVNDYTGNENNNETTNNDIVREPVSQDYCNVVKKAKKENITTENINEIMLCQIPNVSSITAIAIMEHFHSIYELIENLKENPDCLNNLTYESKGKHRKISKLSIENIKKFLITD